MSKRLVSTYELSRIIAKQLESSVGSVGSENQGFMQKTVLKVLTTSSKFVSHLFKKELPSKKSIVVIAEVPTLGQFVMCRGGDGVANQGAGGSSGGNGK